MNVLKTQKQIEVVSLLVEGSSIRSVERVTGVHRDTIMRLLVRVGENCDELMEWKMRDLRCERLEVDELWGFCGRKQSRLAPEDRHRLDMGDQWVFFALDPMTKLIPHFVVGKRNMLTASLLMDTLKARLDPTNRFQLTTDGYVPYIGAVDRAWGMDAPHFAQLVKSYGALPAGPGRYSPPKLLDAIPTVVYGNPDPAHISTSMIERSNLSVRMACRRFTRLTNAFSRKLEHMKAHLALFFAWYNFVKPHTSLRVTPCMAAGITSGIWEISDLLGV